MAHELALWLACCGLLAGGPPDGRAERMAQDAQAAVRRFQGEVFLYAKNLDTGSDFGLRADERVRTASTIKLPIMVAAFAAVEEGRAKWEEQLTLRQAGKVSGSGVLTEFSDGVQLPLRDLVHLMIVVSDNTATNLVLDRVPADRVNAQMDRLGLPQTRALRKVRSDSTDPKADLGWSAAGRLSENQRFGLGVSTPREMVRLLEKIETGQAVSPAASKEMIAILKRQQLKDGIGRALAWPIASKSGALDALRSDVGIVYSPGGRIAIAITCDGMPKVDYTTENVGNKLISELSGLLISGLAK